MQRMTSKTTLLWSIYVRNDISRGERKGIIETEECCEFHVRYGAHGVYLDGSTREAEARTGATYFRARVEVKVVNPADHRQHQDRGVQHLISSVMFC